LSALLGDVFDRHFHFWDFGWGEDMNQFQIEFLGCAVVVAFIIGVIAGAVFA
jgi:hypothetical protein